MTKEEKQLYDNIMNYDRDWEEIKEKFCSMIPEERRNDFLEDIIKVAVYN